MCYCSCPLVLHGLLTLETARHADASQVLAALLAAHPESASVKNAHEQRPLDTARASLPRRAMAPGTGVRGTATGGGREDGDGGSWPSMACAAVVSERLCAIYWMPVVRARRGLLGRRCPLQELKDFERHSVQVVCMIR